MNHIGLFEGIGGFSLGARWMGWETIAWCEINPFCQRVLKKHFPNAKAHTDIRTTDFSIYRGKAGIVTGGFPCKQTSVAAAISGKRNGLDGDDSGLWWEELRAFGEIGAPWVVIENPAGVEQWEDKIQGGLEGIGYTVSRLEFTADDFGLPHSRRRYIYVGNANGKGLEIARPTGSPKAEWFKRLAIAGGSWLQCTPGDGGGINGLPNRVDRVRALGNAVVPYKAYSTFKAISQTA